MLLGRLLCVIAVPLFLAHGQVQRDASLSVFVQLIDIAGTLTHDTKSAFLEGSHLSPDQISIVVNTVGEAFEFGNLEGAAAGMRKQQAELDATVRRRGEILRTLTVKLEERLGADGWAQFQTFLISIEGDIKLGRDACNEHATVYGYGMLVRGHGSMTAVALTDGSYYPGES